MWTTPITFSVVSIAIESVIIIYDMIWKFFVNSFLKYLKVFFFKQKFLIETNFNKSNFFEIIL